MKNRIKVSVIAFILGLNTYSFGMEDYGDGNLPVTNQNQINQEALKSFILDLMKNNEPMYNAQKLSKSTLPDITSAKHTSQNKSHLLTFKFKKSYDKTAHGNIIEQIKPIAFSIVNKKKVNLTIQFIYEASKNRFLEYFKYEKLNSTLPTNSHIGITTAAVGLGLLGYYLYAQGKLPSLPRFNFSSWLPTSVTSWLQSWKK